MYNTKIGKANFTLALRVGELVALHNKDFFDDTVHISRQEIKTYEKRGNNYVRTGYTLVEHTKTIQSTRDLFLTSRANEFLEMIIEANKQRGFENGYLLIDAKGNRIHDYSVNNALIRLNKKLHTIQKANHCIRKTCLSNMLESNELTNKEIQQFAGHVDFATTQKYYLYPTKTKDKRKECYEKAICSKIKNVTNCNQAT